MILVSDAGSMRMSGSCDASTWPLVASSSRKERAATVGAGMVCAMAADRDNTEAARAAMIFFMDCSG